MNRGRASIGLVVIAIIGCWPDGSAKTLWLPKTLSVAMCPGDQVKNRFWGVEWGRFPDALRLK